MSRYEYRAIPADARQLGIAGGTAFPLRQIQLESLLPMLPLIVVVNRMLAR